jgi:hypothetical protein
MDNTEMCDVTGVAGELTYIPDPASVEDLRETVIAATIASESLLRRVLIDFRDSDSTRVGETRRLIKVLKHLNHAARLLSKQHLRYP